MSDNCPTCGKPRGFLMESHPDKPGIVGLLRGEGDYLTQRVAWLAVLLIAFAVTLLLFKLV